MKESNNHSSVIVKPSEIDQNNEEISEVPDSNRKTLLAADGLPELPTGNDETDREVAYLRKIVH